MIRVALCLLFAGGVLSDVYLHVPRGSNNRLHEKSANRQNANRLFDSQNNNRGGYNVGDLTKSPAGSNAEKQYNMKYFMSGPQYKTLGSGKGQSKLTIEWTNQHGIGGNEDTDPHKLNGDIILQYMCQEDVPAANGESASRSMRNGGSQNTNTYVKGSTRESKRQAENRKGRVDTNRGLHEPFEFYDNCNCRERNQGLFTADQKLKKNSATCTRQNSEGNRRGFECPEERDYYPYWHPTPWKDIAVLTSNTSLCSYFQRGSFNVKPYHECVEYWDDSNERKWYSQWNNEVDCAENGGKWTEFANYLEKKAGLTETDCALVADGHQWAVPYDSPDGITKECLVTLDTPDCQQAPWSRVNHLGNGRDGNANTYDWTIPYFPSLNTQRCSLRIRYNISTDDYSPYTTTSKQNSDSKKGVKSPVENTPEVDIGANNVRLPLAINTAQFGRTFQDRSHIFKIRRRPAGQEEARIFNLNVRGKRGNIVQTFPAVEYDFAPNSLDIKYEDLVHIQWTGSNTHDNNNPGGDGQTGDDGQGNGGTDRHNFLQSLTLNDNYPVPYESASMWQKSEAVWIYYADNPNVANQNIAISLATSGYYRCVKPDGCVPSESVAEKRLLDKLLNEAPASYEGVLMKFGRGEYSYLCTRNNAFSNRSQKGSLIVR